MSTMVCGNPIPANEEKRLQIIKDLNILQHYQNDETFNRITVTAAEHFHCPMALITIVGEKTIWFLTKYGLELSEVMRNLSLCQYTILPETDSVLVIPDASVDERSRDLENFKYFGIKFYAACSIRLDDVKIGTICIMDTKLHPDFDGEQKRKLLELGNTISDMIFAKKNHEFGEECLAPVAFVAAACAGLVQSLGTMMHCQSELQESSRKSSHQPEDVNQIETLKKVLNAKRVGIQQELNQSLESINDRKKQHRSCDNSGPDVTLASGQYSKLSDWFNHLQLLVVKNIPNYEKLATHIKFEFPKVNGLQDCEVNEGNLHFLATIFSLLIMGHLQKWKEVRLCFSIEGQQATTDSQGIKKSPRESPRKAVREGCEESAHDYNCEVGCAKKFLFHVGKLSVEMKGANLLKSPRKMMLLSKPAEEFRLFPKESPFFTICDNFLTNSFQLIQADYQKIYGKNEETTKFWMDCYLREIFQSGVVTSPNKNCVSEQPQSRKKSSVLENFLTLKIFRDSQDTNTNNMKTSSKGEERKKSVEVTTSFRKDASDKTNSLELNTEATLTSRLKPEVKTIASPEIKTDSTSPNPQQAQKDLDPVDPPRSSISGFLGFLSLSNKKSKVHASADN